jgi:hypothetical protein
MMPAISKQRRFDILRQALAMAEERTRVPLDEVAAAVDVTPAELKELLEPVLFLSFHTKLGELLDESGAFLFTEDDELALTERHWLRDLAADPPSDDVALRLLVAGIAMQSVATAPTTDLDVALEKLGGVVGARLELSVPGPPALAAAREAWTDGRSLRFRYVRDNDDAVTDREVLPHRVFCKWSHWYVQGRELDQSATKVFRVDRMHDARVGEVTFEPPPDSEIPDWFDLAAHELHVTLRMRPDQIDALARPIRITAQRALDDGRVDVDVVVTGPRRLDHLLVTLDPDVEVIAPDEAHMRRREHAAALLTAYE